MMFESDLDNQAAMSLFDLNIREGFTKTTLLLSQCRSSNLQADQGKLIPAKLHCPRRLPRTKKNNVLCDELISSKMSESQKTCNVNSEVLTQSGDITSSRFEHWLLLRKEQRGELVMYAR
jgi:hypothetical protein